MHFREIALATEWRLDGHGGGEVGWEQGGQQGGDGRHTQEQCSQDGFEGKAWVDAVWIGGHAARSCPGG